MIILTGTPAADNYYMPAEYAPHDGCIMVWPIRRSSWPENALPAQKAFARVAEEIAESESVIMCVAREEFESARRRLSEHILVVPVDSDDAWARDYAPTFVVDKKGGRRGINWGFNAWGGAVDGLYPSWEKDNALAEKLCKKLDIDMYDASDFILEGGSFHTDGEGTLLTTENCLLSKGRNPQLSKIQIEQKLMDYLNIQKVIWLKYGIYQDETNEHVDNICAFTAPGEVVLAWTEDKADPQYEMSRDCYERLSSQTDAKGRQLKVHKLRLPKPVLVTKKQCTGIEKLEGEEMRVPGERLAASYVNFYISNKAVLVPAFDDDADKEAAGKLAELFPDRRIVQIPARDILIGGGNIHCITQQIPSTGISI